MLKRIMVASMLGGALALHLVSLRAATPPFQAPPEATPTPTPTQVPPPAPAIGAGDLPFDPFVALAILIGILLVGLIAVVAAMIAVRRSVKTKIALADCPFVQGAGIPRVTLTRATTILGRGVDCHIRIADSVAGAETVAAQHARIEQRGAQWVIVDGDVTGKPSPQGILLQHRDDDHARRTLENYLEDGDTITCGAVTLHFYLPHPTAAPLPEPTPHASLATRRLSPPAFDDLPRGAIVAQRFHVLQTFETTPYVNTYLAEDLRDHTQVRLCEASRAAQYEREQRLVEYEVQHPALVAIKQVCHAQYGDAARAYLAVEFPLAPFTPAKYSETQILRWGIQLADALAHLHAQQLAHGNIQLASLFLADTQIKLGDYARLTAYLPELGAQDIAQLTNTLAQLSAPAPRFAPEVAAIWQRPAPYADSHALKNALQLALDALRRQTGIITTVGRLSDIGMRRELDEDALITLEIAQGTHAGCQVVGLYAVADGMGGASAGEIASKLATDTLAREITQNLIVPRVTAAGEINYAAVLQAAVEQANREVHQARAHAQSDMGSTLVAALVIGTQAHIANVGDSRAYLITPDAITRITKDHSFVQVLVERGHITEADARTHPQRNLILRNVGEKPEIVVDLFTLALEAGQHLLLCCDGLWEMVPDETIAALVRQHALPQAACRALIQAANANGGNDNITCVLVRIENLGDAA